MNLEDTIQLPKGSRIVAAMSGGVDSSVTAALLKEQGYDVVGITLQLYDHGQALQKKGACCAGQDIHDAREVAAKLEIPHYVLNYESRFKESVMEDFAESYLRGETPIPCVTCNQTVKFKDLLQTARDLGAVAMATGHYVQRVGEGKAELHRAADPNKDQSYFLFATTQEQLDYLRFPLGGLTKDQTRALAGKYGLPVQDKPDSQDICFVPSGGYAKVVERLRPGALDAGDIVHLDGTVLGKHQGVIHYTVGQRKGLDIGGLSEPLYVVKIDAENHRVIVGPREALAITELRVANLNWLGDQPLNGKDVPVRLKYRSTHHGVDAAIRSDDHGGMIVRFEEPQYGVSPGQAAVAYDDERLLGGGWISRSL